MERSKCLAAALRTLSIARARAGAARAGWWAKPRSSTKGPIRALGLSPFPAEGLPGEPEERFELPRSTRSSTVRAEKWKTASRRRAGPLCRSHQHGLEGLQPTPALVLGFRPSHALGAAGRGVGAPIWPRLPSARSGSSFSRMVLASRSVADHIHLESASALIPTRKLSGAPVPSLRDAGGLTSKEPL